MLAANTCPLGYYCPAQSNTQAYGKKACSAGSYNPIINVGSQSDCQPCRIGSFCNGSGATDVSGPCVAGTFCPIGSTSADAAGSPVHIIGTTVEGPCPKGFMCPAGT